MKINNNMFNKVSKIILKKIQFEEVCALINAIISIVYACFSHLHTKSTDAIIHLSIQYVSDVENI